MSKTITALTIAGSDPSAGAGVQADLKTFSALGVYGCSVITAITAQNTLGVTETWALPEGSVKQQITTLLDDVSVAAIKIGMLFNEVVINEVEDALTYYYKKQVTTDYKISIVCDPVIVSSSGKPLLSEDGIKALKDFLKKIGNELQQPLIITPNINEAARLLETEVAQTDDEMIDHAERLLEFGCAAVVLTGGDRDHQQAGEEKQSIDVFVARENQQQTCEIFRAKKIQTKNTHGSGCTFSSAIAAGLAKQMAVGDAVAMAKEYVTYAIAHADEINISDGAGPLQHFYQ